MNEKEKMLNGFLYDANYDKTLIEERIKCKTLCSKFNNLPYENTIEKTKILKQILRHTGKNFHIEPYFWCDYGYNIEIGENFYSNHNLVILDCAKVTFGNNVFIAPNCGFYTAGHPIDVEQRNKGLEYAKPIKVGNNVWIGANVTILAGVTIGDNCTIGANSLVTKDIPPCSLAYGSPCRVIKTLE